MELRFSERKTELKIFIVSLVYVLLEVILMAILLQNNSLFYALVEAPDSVLKVLKVIPFPLLSFFIVFEVYLVLPMFIFFVFNWITKLISGKLFWKLQLWITVFIALFTLTLSTINIGG